MQPSFVARASLVKAWNGRKVVRSLLLPVVLAFVSVEGARAEEVPPLKSAPAETSAKPQQSNDANPKPDAKEAASKPDATLPTPVFLDRLMMAESGGRADAKNSRSTALGPFQFIEATFLDIMRRHYPSDIAGMSDEQILALRTSLDHARRAALAYTNENAAQLAANGLPATSVNLRLAFLLGSSGAVRLLTATQDTPLSQILTTDALTANPFMGSMTAADLVRRARYDMSADVRVAGLVPPGPVRPAIQIRCKIGLASCRKWVALQRKKLARGKPQRQASQ